MPVRPRIVAHRGDSAHAPENTLPALAAAIAAGADAVEFDVRLSRDGVPVVIHDPDLRRYGAGSISVARRSAAELARCDVGCWFARRFTGVGVPTLDAWLAAAPRRLGLCLELKPGRDDADRLVRAVIACLRRHRARDRTWLLCFQVGPLRLAHRLEPRLRLVRNVVALPARPRAWLRDQPPLVAVDGDVARLDPQRATALRDAGLAVWCWTCRTTADLRRARAAGCTALIANDPAWCRRQAGR